MTELPTPVRIATVTDADLQAVLADLTPGRYTTRDLFPRYEGWATGKGHVVASRNSFGMALRRVLGAPVAYAHGHVGVYEIG